MFSYSQYVDYRGLVLQVIQRLNQEIDGYRQMRAEGWELKDSFIDDYGHMCKGDDSQTAN